MELVIRLRDSSFRAEIGWISKTSFYIVLVTDQLSNGAICANKIIIKPAHAKSDGQRSAGSKVSGNGQTITTDRFGLGLPT